MTRKFILTLPLLLALFTGCGLRNREAVLEKKEAAIIEREKQLEFKEKSLQLKEEELLVWEKRIDSTRKDTAVHKNDTIIGSWNVKMTCIETSCSGSAIGDSKSETWHFTYQDKNILVKAMAGEKLVRVYSGTYDGETIVLTEDVSQTFSAPGIKISVRLSFSGGNNLQGERQIIREDDCKILYRLQLNKQ